MLIKFLIYLAVVVSGSSERQINYAENPYIGFIIPARSARCDQNDVTWCPSYIKKMDTLEYEERQILKRKDEYTAENPQHFLLETPRDYQWRLDNHNYRIKEFEDNMKQLKQAKQFLEEQANQGIVPFEYSPCYR